MVDSELPPLDRQLCWPGDMAPALSEDEARAVREFVSRVGGVENARQALATLALLQSSSS